MDQETVYPARLDIDYPEKMNRLTTFFRIILIVPIAVIIALISGTGNETVISATGEVTQRTVGGIASGLFVATLLMILFRQRYPRWWFDFALQFTRFGTRFGAYLFFLTDQYPSTEDEQAVHLELDYPDAKTDLKRGLPLIKWFLAIPHYIVLIVFWIGAAVVTVVAWFAILFTGRYPKSMFDFVVGVARWSLRVQAYAFLLITDEYPPFGMN